MGGVSLMLLDLNAKRAARAAKRGGGLQMILGTETFDLVDDLPLEIGELANEGKMADAFRIMLRDPDGDWDRLTKCRPSFQDVLDVVEFFGSTLGESVRSIGSSETTGEPSKPTLTAITNETSPMPATAMTVSAPAEWSPTSMVSPMIPPTDAS